MKRKANGTERCETCTLRAKAIICDLTGEELASFQKIRHTFQYDAHQTVFYEGHACLGLYLLCAGRVKLTRSSTRGQRQIVRILDAGEVIEKHGFQEDAVHQVTCETLEPSQVCLVEREPYLELVRHDADLAVKLIRFLSGELGRQVESLDSLAFKNARQRVAGVLLDLGQRFGRPGSEGVQVDIKLKREELAEMAGVTVETVIRLLSALRDEGLIRTQGKAITLVDQEALTRITRV
jgi:CRP/FNR family transcriptional regulator